jgi:hypothetical protein
MKIQVYNVLVKCTLELLASVITLCFTKVFFLHRNEKKLNIIEMTKFFSAGYECGSNFWKQSRV